MPTRLRFRNDGYGEENPRSGYAEQPEGPSTRVTRERQLRDDVKSGGTQPADSRVIHCRNKPTASRSRHVGRSRSIHNSLLPAVAVEISQIKIFIFDAIPDSCTCTLRNDNMTGPRGRSWPHCHGLIQRTDVPPTAVCAISYTYGVSTSVGGSESVPDIAGGLVEGCLLPRYGDTALCRRQTGLGQ